MPEETEGQPSAEYKSMQRLVGRLQKENASLRTENLENRGSLDRLSKDMEGFFAIYGRQDPEAKPVIEEYLKERSGQMEFNAASVRAEKRVAELLGEGEEWDGDAYDSARGRLADARASGDAGRFDEVIRQMESDRQSAGGSPVTREEMEEVFREMLHSDRAEGARVDTQTGTKNDAGSVTRQGLNELMDSGASHADLAKALEQTYSQLAR